MIYILIPLLLLLVGFGLWLNPEWVIARLRHTSPEVLYAVDINQPYIALTIDDGPDSTTSAMILDLLKENDAKATFFLISDHILGNETILRRMVSEGHELGNHMTKDEPSIRLTSEEFELDLLQAKRILSKYDIVRWFRPGSGWYNDEMLEVARKHGYKCALGSVYPFDPQIGSAWLSEHYVLWKVKPGDVIVLHDHLVRGKRTVSILETLLPALKNRGYHLVTLTELSNLVETNGSSEE